MNNKLLVCKMLKDWDVAEVGEIADEHDWADKVGYTLFESESVQFWEAVQLALDKVDETYISLLEHDVAVLRDSLQTIASFVSLVPAPIAIRKEYPEEVNNLLRAYINWLTVANHLVNKK